MEKSIFKVGDTVYHWKRGRGWVSNINSGYIRVDYETIKGVHEEKDELSFTPYDLVNGGFSQERPFEFEAGKWYRVQSGSGLFLFEGAKSSRLSGESTTVKGVYKGGGYRECWEVSWNEEAVRTETREVTSDEYRKICRAAWKAGYEVEAISVGWPRGRVNDERAFDLKTGNSDFRILYGQKRKVKKIVPYTFEEVYSLVAGGMHHLKRKDDGELWAINCVRKRDIQVGGNKYAYDKIMNFFTHLDGAPFGKEVEE